MRITRTGIVFSAAYLVLGVAWALGATPPGPVAAYIAWFVVVAIVGAFIPGIANQVSLARAYLAGPALAYSVTADHLGLLAVVLAVAGLTDLVDGTIARRFDRPSTLGGGLDPVVDGLLLGAVAMGLVVGGILPLWLAMVIVLRYLVPAVVGFALIVLHRRPELRHTLSGQVSTALIIILVGGICLFRFFNQDASNVVVGAELVIPVATVATFIHLGWAARTRRPPVAAPEGG
ncbi:MAG TPA: CDP-alcohol phosphatidyltransferase family protein [Candidatus Dormibacteraeota bacterium]|nr:CDP-alcohol phosphatidyltransferase family protein [Candidatus Dormibacteraeota bacterium]